MWVGGCVTAPVAWTSGPSALASRGPWGRRHRGTRDPPGHARDLGNAGVYTDRRKWPLSVVFGSFVYTVATREGHAQGRGNAGVYTNRRKWPLGAVLGHLCTLLRLARVMRKWRRREAGVFAETATHTNPEESSIETGQVSGPIDARFGRFRLVGRLWCVERCARLTKRARAGRPPRPSRAGRTQPT